MMIRLNRLRSRRNLWDLHRTEIDAVSSRRSTSIRQVAEWLGNALPVTLAMPPCHHADDDREGKVKIELLSPKKTSEMRHHRAGRWQGIAKAHGR